MEKRFGYGDYERSDVETRISTQDLRHHFLRTLVTRKGRWASDLVRIANFHLLPEEIRTSFSNTDTFCFFLPYLFGANPNSIVVDPEYFNTPLYHFVEYEKKNIKRLVRYERSKEFRHFAGKPSELRRLAWQKLVPNWRAFTLDPDSSEVCGLIKRWAKTHNLDSEWCLDFALTVLISFRTLFTFPKDEFKEKEHIATRAQTYLFHFESRLREALGESLIDFSSGKIRNPIWSMTGPEIQPFHFKSRDFEGLPTTWFPYLNYRTEFLKDAHMSFKRRCDAIRDLSKYEYVEGKTFADSLERYCDSVEEQLLHTKAFIPFLPHTVKHLNEITVFSAYWTPEEMTRKEFIGIYLDNLDRGFRRYKAMAKSLEDLDKDKFDSELFLYCNRVEKSLPANYVKTPIKYKNSERDFRWLVDYQVDSTKDFNQIAAAEEHSGPVTGAMVKKAVYRLGQQIGLLRKGVRRGRPRGVTETHKRRRH